MITNECPSNLCSDSTCLAHPTAFCEVDNCGECSAKYYDSNSLVEVTTTCGTKMIIFELMHAWFKTQLIVQIYADFLLLSVIAKQLFQNGIMMHPWEAAGRLFTVAVVEIKTDLPHWMNASRHVVCLIYKINVNRCAATPLYSMHDLAAWLQVIHVHLINLKPVVLWTHVKSRFVLNIPKLSAIPIIVEDVMLSFTMTTRMWLNNAVNGYTQNTIITVVQVLIVQVFQLWIAILFHNQKNTIYLYVLHVRHELQSLNLPSWLYSTLFQ